MYLFSATVCITLVLTLGLAGPADGGTSLEPRLSTFWDDWIAESGLLMSDEELSAFDALDDTETREAFAAAFWASRGSEALDRWTRNRRAADQLRPRSNWARRAILLFGMPASIERIEACGGLRPLQVWRWDPWHIARQGGDSAASRVLVLTLETRLLPDSYRPWDPNAVADLGYAGSRDADIATYLDHVKPKTCVSARLRDALTKASTFAELQRLMPWPTPGGDWLVGVSTSAGSEPTQASAARLEVDYAGNHGRHTIVHGVLRLDRDQMHELVPGWLFDRITFVGDIYKRDYLVDSFEVVHHIAGSTPTDEIELDLYRGLRPGHYDLELRVFDRNGLTLLHGERTLDVPRMSSAAPQPPGRRQGYDQLTRSEVVLLDTLPSVEVLPISSRTTSRTNLVAITTGGPISTVAFYLDGRLVAEDDTSPYSTNVELTAERHRVEAVAVDAAGHRLASHSREVDTAPRPFRIHLGRPGPDEPTAPVTISIPSGDNLLKLECFDGRNLVSTRSAPPFDCPLPKLYFGGLRYARAVATLTSGHSTEQILFFGPNAPENIDVQLVQLFVSVFDSRGRPVRGLSESDFRVWQQGRQLQLDCLESLADLPISVAVLMDLSSSMGRLAGLAAESAQHFFENILVDGDLASLLAFNDGFYQLVPFSRDIAELRLGAEGVRALGSTRLNDGIVWALSQYAGQENRRALVILSDGADVNSDFEIEQVVAAAVDAGVVVYPISLARHGEQPPEQLQILADSTGGTRFIVSSISELDTAYRRIANELRSQYLLVYRQPEDSPDSGLGAVDIEVLRAGHTTRNVRGYYQ